MNRQIRQLARRPDGLLRRAVRRPQLLAGRPPAGAQRPRSTTPAPSAASSSSRAATIVTTDGVVIAQSVQNPPGSEFTYQREYPTGELFAHVTGYYTFAFGSTGLERTQNAVLTGEHRRAAAAQPPGHHHRAPTTRARCCMTLRNDLQQVAKDALGEREGSVVVIDPATGAVGRCGASRATTPTSSPTPTSTTAQDVINVLQELPRQPAARPTPTSSATCRVRRSRCSRPASPSRTASST